MSNVHNSPIERLEPRTLLAAAIDPIVDSYLPPLHSEWNASEFLTDPSSVTPLNIAIDYLRSRARQLGLKAADVAEPIVTDHYSDPTSGLTHIYLRQRANGLEIVNANANVNVMPDGRILSLNSSFVGGLTAKLGEIAIKPRITAAQALSAVAGELGIAMEEPTRAGRTAGRDHHSTLRNASLSLDDIPARLHYVPSADGGAELSWNLVVRTPDGNQWYDISVGDASRKITFISDWMDALETYNIYPLPTEAPNDGIRIVVGDPADLIASPFGWLDTNGVAGADSTQSTGNNVDAREDIDGNDTGGARADGGPALSFDFSLDLTQPPSTYRPAAITNLFYWNNVLHDVHYKYGFTEAAGNFQVNNYGRGGLGADAVQADAQDGEGTNNANFGTPPDGEQPRMQMFLFTAPNPDIDGDFDNMVIAHEYGHGVSNRLTGGPANSNALDALQSGGMGEGWSDFYSLMFTQKPTDTLNQAYPVGTYVLNQPTTGPGIRRVPYSYNMTIDPLTFEAYGTSGTTTYGIPRSTEVHDTGEIWCSALWDLNWLLINKYGYNSDLYTGYTITPGPGHAGNKLALRLVMDAMKLQPPNPTFIEARNAILQADQALTGGANFLQIWQAFARRGLGADASTLNSDSTTVVIDFDIPVPDPFVISHAPSGTAVAPVSLIDFNFNQQMDPASFSLADDVITFTGPSGNNLKSTISSFTWQSPTKLRVNFAPTTARGAYAMVIGPNILSLDNANPMDMDADGIAGEVPDDRYTASFTYNTTLGPDGFGYKAVKYNVENLNLIAGQSGVVQLINGVDDTNAPIALGGSTFNYYGTNYSTVFASSNGLVTLGTGTNGFMNGDLTTTPTQAAIAVLWDDWRTDQNAPGSDSAVLYKFDSGRLIIEWSDIVNRVAGDGTATFQAILQLNTGAQPGRIILSYPDITTNNATQTNGGSASVGIKNSGTQHAANPNSQRILVSRDSGNHPWVTSGGALLFSGIDVDGPTVTASAFHYLTSHSITATFSENVSASLSNIDLMLHNDTTNTTVNTGAQAVSYDLPSNTATFTFPGLPGALLGDGEYTARLLSPGISDAAGNHLDGDDNGVIGGDFVLEFSFLRGDANHDGRVNLVDYNVVASNFGLSPRDFSQGDFSYDGLVNLVDYNLLASRFGMVLGPDDEMLFARQRQDRDKLPELT